MTRRLLPLVLLPCIASAPLAEEARIPFTCDNGSLIEIAFPATADGRPQAVVHFADEAVWLPRVPAATGATYRQDGLVLHLQDDDAMLEDGKGNRRQCRRGHVGPATPQAAAPAGSFVDIAGSVTYPLRIALPPDAVLTVLIQDRPQAGGPRRTLAEQSIALTGRQVPIAFDLTVDRDLLGKTPRLTVSARIERAGKLLFVSDKHYPATPDRPAEALVINLRPASVSQKK